MNARYFEVYYLTDGALSVMRGFRNIGAAVSFARKKVFATLVETGEEGVRIKTHFPKGSEGVISQSMLVSE
jgi:hypothetical protein